MSCADWLRVESDVVVAQMFSSFLHMQEAHLSYVILWQQNSDIFFPFLSTDPDQQDACQKVVPFHKMMSSAIKKLFHIPSSARIVSFYEN